jgi:hypothetical protein
LSFKGPQHAAEITGVNSQAATKLANFGTVVSNLPKQSSLVHWATSLEKPVADGTDALRNCSVETADFLNRGYLYFSDHSQRLSPKLSKQATGLRDGHTGHQESSRRTDDAHVNLLYDTYLTSDDAVRRHGQWVGTLGTDPSKAFPRGHESQTKV